MAAAAKTVVVVLAAVFAVMKVLVSQGPAGKCAESYEHLRVLATVRYEIGGGVNHRGGNNDDTAGFSWERRPAARRARRRTREGRPPGFLVPRVCTIGRQQEI